MSRTDPPPPTSSEDIDARQALDRMTLAQALRLFHADLRRRSQLLEQRLTPWALLAVLAKPSGMGLLQLRVGNWMHARGWFTACRLMERLIVLTARSELQLGSRIGPGLVLPDQGTVGISGQARIGANCTFFALSTVIFQSVPDAGAEFGIGDHCVIGRRARIYGPVSLGAGTQVKDGSVVMVSFPREGQVLSGVPARRRSTVAAAELRAWNPLKGKRLDTAAREGKA